MDQTTKIARACGKCPDWAWYQLNGKSAEENLAEQRERILSDLLAQEEPAPVDEIHIVSEVRFK